MNARSLSVVVLLGVLLGVSSAGASGPKLFFDAADIPALRARLHEEPYASMFARVLGLPDSMPADPSYVRDVQYARADNAIHYATLYLFTGEEQYAAKARDFSLQLVGDADWARNSYRALSRAYMCRGVAIAYDLTKSSGVWDGHLGGASVDDRTFVSRRLKAMGDSLMANGGDGYNSMNNWRAVRYSAAGLAYLATDEPVAGSGTYSLANAHGNLRVYYELQMTTSPESRGWIVEPINYATYPAAFTLTYNQALARRHPSMDLIEDDALAGIRHQMAAVAFSMVPIAKGGAYVGGEGNPNWGIVPDWGNGHTSYRSEGTAALALANAAPEHVPALRWIYDHVVGLQGDQRFDATDRYMGLFSLLNYPADVEARNPAEVWGLTYHDPVAGMTMFRNRFQDSGDIVAGIQARHRYVVNNHSGPDVNSVRIIGRNTLWAVGAGSGDARGQTTVFPYDPLITGTGSGSATGRTVATHFEEDGSGWAIVDGSSVGTEGHRRRFVTDYSGLSGSDALFVISDTSSNGGWWRLNTGGMNDISLTPEGFVLTSPDGERMFGLILHGQAETLRAGALDRANYRIAYEGAHYDNGWVDFHSPDGEFLVVLMLLGSDQALPAVHWEGIGALGTLMIDHRMIEIGYDGVVMSHIPEPATVALLGAGCLALLGRRRQ